MKKAVDDMFIPVMPRILDPSLKFNEESILSGLEKSRLDFQKTKNANEVAIDIPDTEGDVSDSNKKSFITVIAKYKLYIFIILGVIILCGMIYYFYRQYKKTNIKEKKSDILENNPVNTKSKENTENLENKDNKKSVSEISNYLSNYIDVASESDSSSVVENVEIEDLDSIIPPILVPIEEEINSDADSVSDTDSMGGERFENLNFESDTESEQDIKENTESADNVNVDMTEDEDAEDKALEEPDTLLQEAHDPVDIFNKYNK